MFIHVCYTFPKESVLRNNVKYLMLQSFYLEIFPLNYLLIHFLCIVIVKTKIKKTNKHSYNLRQMMFYAISNVNIFKKCVCYVYNTGKDVCVHVSQTIFPDKEKEVN